MNSMGWLIHQAQPLQLTLEIVAFTIHEDIVDQDDAENTCPEMDVAEHQHESNILVQRGFKIT